VIVFEYMVEKILSNSKVVFSKGRPSEVILRWADFRQLLEKIEDSYDLTEIKKAKEAGAKFRNIDDVLKNHAV